ncbi:Single Cache domain 2 [anaerobic digester metagenome]
MFSVIILACVLIASAGCLQGGTGSGPTLPPSPVLTEATGVTPNGTLVSNETLVSFVESAAAFVEKEGKERALQEFSDPNGSFVRGELYIYAYDFNGTTLAHPINPEKIGQNRLNETENGVGDFLASSMAAARDGGGFVRISYINPAHNRSLESKLVYVQKIDDEWWLGSGVYSGTVNPPTGMSG